VKNIRNMIKLEVAEQRSGISVNQNKDRTAILMAELMNNSPAIPVKRKPQKK
jgi:hypothetical protein